MRKTLKNPQDVEDIVDRIMKISENSERKWGKMSAAQMISHCDKILQVGTGKTVLPDTNFFIKAVGICTKLEMKIFNNGIPPNMPTFDEVIIKENCNLEKSRTELLRTIDEFIRYSETDKLIREHALFGKMSREDWCFLQYKHINHHLKQFKV